MAHDVFISHSSKDHKLAENMCAVLEQHGVNCWIAPRDVTPGAIWPAAIVEAIRNCRCMVLILSEDSNESSLVLREVEQAVNKAKPIIPFRISDVTPSDAMEYFISSSHWMDAHKLPLKQSFITLANLVTNVIGTVESPSASDDQKVAIVDTLESKSRPRIVLIVAAISLVCMTLLFFSGVGRNRHDQSRSGPNWLPTPEQQPKVPDLDQGPSSVEQKQSEDTTDGTVNEESDGPRIAVLYFENQSDGEKDLDALAKGLCSMMITRLDDTHKYDLVERQRLQEVLDELKLTRSAMFDQTNVASIGKLVGARFLVLGSYFEILNVFRIDARLVDVETGVTVTAAGVEGKSDEFSALLSQLVDQLVKKHQGVDDPDSKSGDIEQPKDESVSRVSLSLASDLGEAVNAYDQGEVDTALAKLDALIEANPEFDEARKLSKRWREPRRESNSDPEKEATRASK